MGTKAWKMLVVTVGLLFTAAGCASKQDLDYEKQLEQQNEHRLQSLEDTVRGLNEQLSVLNNRVYEVRTKSGKKTGMTVAPINLSANNVVDQKTAAVPKPVTTPKPVPVATKAAKGPNTKKQAQALKKGAKTKEQLQANNRNLPKEQIPASPTNFALPPDEATNSPNLPPADVSLPLTEPGTAALPPTLPIEGAIAPALPPAAQAAPVQQQVSKPQKSAGVPKALAGEEAQYKSALRAAQSGRSQEGIQKFRQFLQKYPNGKYAANAEFWIGECLYSQGKYQEALGQFKTVNAKYPGHHKNADALLKAGMTYKRLGDQANATSNYQQLMQQFPKSEAARRARSGR